MAAETSGGSPARRRSWIALSVQAPPGGEEFLLAEALRRLGGRGLERTAGRVTAYLPAPADLPDLLARAEGAVRSATTLAEPGISWRRLDPGEEARLWGRTLRRRQVTGRIVVEPAGPGDPPVPDDAARPRDAVVVRLHPGPGFGSGEHPTTRAALRLIERLLAPGEDIADVGTGSGILAIAAVKLGAGSVTAYERDAVACEGAHLNLAENHVAGRIRLRLTEARAGTLRADGPFDGIAANIAAGPILSLLPAFRAALRGQGWLVVAGVSGGEKAAVRDAAAAAGLALSHEEVTEGWWSAAFHQTAGRLPERSDRDRVGTGTHLQDGGRRMDVPPEVAFRGLEPTEALKDRILEGIEDLESVYDRLVSCRVMVEDTTSARHSGKIYRVRLEIGVPNQTVLVDRRPADAEDTRDPTQAVKNAFDIARRRLGELKDKQRREVKTPGLPPHGRVVELLTDEEGVRYGFLEAEDGREIYFHENALVDLDYDELEVGSEVRFAEGRGDEGPQASTVARLHPRKVSPRHEDEIPLQSPRDGA